ncbi:hypothetical protein IWX90DRAFT_420515 [Phyllosticta citrichinensis]|uniref:Uncharacterized protein n=1 Tax=Phyllosticta citrichinensis TaxID=1130410 RepID=A0ABR1Y5Q1_9PEZI
MLSVNTSSGLLLFSLASSLLTLGDSWASEGCSEVLEELSPVGPVEASFFGLTGELFHCDEDYLSICSKQRRPWGFSRTD